MKHTLLIICTLLNLKKLKSFLNITEYKVFLIKSFQTINYFLLIYSSIRSLVICKYRFKFKSENGPECGIGVDYPVVDTKTF